MLIKFVNTKLSKTITKCLYWNMLVFNNDNILYISLIFILL